MRSGLLERDSDITDDNSCSRRSEGKDNSGISECEPSRKRGLRFELKGRGGVCSVSRVADSDHGRA